MRDYVTTISEAVRATVFDSPSSFRWFGELSRQLPRSLLREMTDFEVRAYLLESLQLTLYRDFYCRGFARPTSEDRIGLGGRESGHFVREVSRANCGLGSWEEGWSVQSVETGGAMVAWKQLAVRVRREDVENIPGDPLVPGARLRLRYPKESLRGAPGYYVAFGDAPFAENARREVVRFYFNLRAKGAAPVMARVTTLLNHRGLPFQFKVLSDPNQYVRRDAGVLYVQKRDYEAVAETLSHLYPEAVDYLKPGTPAFAKPLAYGLGFAEDPGDEESFGRSRCRVLAAGMIRAHEQGMSSPDDRVAVVARTFQEAGISLTMPYLNPGSRDGYGFRVSETQPRQPSRGRLAPRDLISTVTAIADQLCRQAVWDQTRCTWLGGEAREDAKRGRELRSTVRALGPELYAGSCGVGLFLAEAHRMTGDPTLRKTARGAVQHALSRVDAIPASQRIGLFTGLVGIALAAARVGQLCGDVDLMRRSKDLALAAMGESERERDFDLLSGRAGAIVGLLALSWLLDCQPLVSLAGTLADELLQSAERSERGASWRGRGAVGGPNQIGFSHGTAGVGYALLELSRVLGDAPEYRRTAEEAFRYEQSWFDPSVRNWPHFNTAGGASRRFDARPTFVSHWCHGAPGIAASRLRAYRLYRNPEHKNEAIAGLETTRLALESWLASDVGNFSLCHGFAGNAEILDYASRILEEYRKDGGEISREVASRGIAAYSDRESQWPCGCGVTSEEHPGLMVGLAGIGYYYLRLLDPRIPSILILEPEEFAAPLLPR